MNINILQFYENDRFFTTVPDLVSQIRDVILVGAYLAQENPRGSGFGMGRGWGGDGKGVEMERSVYKQPGTKVDGILSHQGGFPSK